MEPGCAHRSPANLPALAHSLIWFRLNYRGAARLSICYLQLCPPARERLALLACVPGIPTPPNLRAGSEVPKTGKGASALPRSFPPPRTPGVGFSVRARSRPPVVPQLAARLGPGGSATIPSTTPPGPCGLPPALSLSLPVVALTTAHTALAGASRLSLSLSRARRRRYSCRRSCYRCCRCGCCGCRRCY